MIKVLGQRILKSCHAKPV